MALFLPIRLCARQKKTREFTVLGCFGLPPKSCLGICAGNRSKNSGFICLGSRLESWMILSPDNCQEKSSPNVSFRTSGLKAADSVEGNTAMLCNMVLDQSYV